MTLPAKNVDIAIIGAGFAGAATAFHLSKSFDGSMLVLEREKIAGFHASGRNAALVLQAGYSERLHELTVLSRRAFEEVAEEIGFRQKGSLLLGSPKTLSPLQASPLLETQLRTADQVRAEIPLLAGHEFEQGLWTPSDGVVNTAKLLDFYLGGARGRGTEVDLDCHLLGIVRNGSSWTLDTSHGTIHAETIINAAGAWAPSIGKMADATRVGLSALKRHLFVLGVEGIDPAWPFVWNLDKDFYFRPGSGGLLFSVCDEEPSASLEPTVSDEVKEILAELIWKELPAFADATQSRVWSCFRTRTPDHRFVIGWDRRQTDFFWVSGLGGSGVGTSWEMGRLAALQFEKPEDEIIPEFRPLSETERPD